jgi:hypothetical protein
VNKVPLPLSDRSFALTLAVDPLLHLRRVPVALHLDARDGRLDVAEVVGLLDSTASGHIRGGPAPPPRRSRRMVSRLRSPWGVVRRMARLDGNLPLGRSNKSAY